MTIIVNISREFAKWQKTNPGKMPSTTEVATLACNAWKINQKRNVLTRLKTLIAVDKGIILGTFKITNKSKIGNRTRFTLVPTKSKNPSSYGNLKYFTIKFIP